MANKSSDIRASWPEDPAAEPAELEAADTAAAADPIAPDNTDDPFNLANLRLDQSFVQTAGAQKLLTTIPVRKPNRQDFCRVHPTPSTAKIWR
jgi:hypothetical protein